MYETIARFYDAIHAELTEDITFVLNLASEIGNPVLEMGCGTGRILRPLAANGFQAVGVDNSAEMLARIPSHPNITVYQQDLLTLDLPQTNFGFALFSHNTAHHFTAEQLATILGRLRRHMRFGSRLMLDLFNPLLLERVESSADFGVERVILDPIDRQRVVQRSRWTNDDEKRILTVEWLYETESGEAIPAQTDYHYIMPDDLLTLLMSAGYTRFQLFGDYDRSQFDDETPRMLVIAR